MREAQRCLGLQEQPVHGRLPGGRAHPGFPHGRGRRRFQAAARILRVDNALPATTGRVCPQEVQCEGVCIRALDGLSCLGPEGRPALAEVLPLLTNQNNSVKIKAIFALTEMSPKTESVRSAVPALAQASGDFDWSMRLAALYALAALHPTPPEAKPVFAKLLHDPE